MKELKITNKLDKVSRKDLRKIAKISKIFCTHYLGVNRRHTQDLKISIRKLRIKENYLGEYCPYQNKITLFVNRIPTLGDFIHTFIHEYCHSLQPIKTRYNKLLNEHGYENHPYEIEADEIADKLLMPLWNYLRKD